MVARWNFCSRWRFVPENFCRRIVLVGLSVCLCPQPQDEKTGKRVPGVVGKSIYPAPNQFVLFEVSSKSFHQVSEILSTGKARLSVNGWFHARDSSKQNGEGSSSDKQNDHRAPNVAALPAPAVPSSLEDSSTWTRLALDSVGQSSTLGQYSNAAVLENAAEQLDDFSEQGHTAVEQFLNPQKSAELYRALRNDDMCGKINWHVPYDLHRSGYWHYVSLTDVDRFQHSQAAQTITKIFLDPHFFQWLQACTGFPLVHREGMFANSLR